MARYGKAAQKKVEEVMGEYKRGKLKSGRGGKGGKVKSRQQAIAIGLSEARERGAKVPKKKSANSKGTTKKGAAKRATKKGATKKSATKKGASKRGSRKSVTKKSGRRSTARKSGPKKGSRRSR